MTSPVDGVVLSRLVDDEQFVPAGETLVRIGCLADLEVEADVLTQDAARLPSGARRRGLRIGRAGNRGGPVTGKVRRVFPQAFTKISSLGVEQQRVTVLVELSDQAVQSMLASQIGADYRVRVRIYAQQRDHVLVLPRSALFRDPEGGWQVFVVRKGRARVQDIEIGLMNDDRVRSPGDLAREPWSSSAREQFAGWYSREAAHEPTPSRDCRASECRKVQRF